jgi:putative hydrolase of the HAD superfamily
MLNMDSPWNYPEAIIVKMTLQKTYLLNSMNYLIWDFDGTLAYRQGGLWSAALLEIIHQANPASPVTIDQLRPWLQTGFPWHTPQRPHPEIQTAGQWWNALDGLFEKAFLGVGIQPVQAKELAKKVRLVYPNPGAWRLFEDVLPTLEQLSQQGWVHFILSNHVPELRQIIQSLPLNNYIAHIFNSAETGYEKPHKQAFAAVLDTLQDIEKIWMIGDNLEVDIAGAASSGIPGILVRKFHANARYFCETLQQIPALI